MHQYDYSSLHHSVSLRELWSELPHSKSSLITVVFIFGLSVAAIVLKVYVTVLILGVILAVAVVMLVQRLTTSIALRRFAEINGLVYVGAGYPIDLPGAIFQRGRDQHFENGVADTRENWLMANYRYTIGSGKNSTTHQDGVTCFKMTRPMPHVLIQSAQGGSHYSLAADLSVSQRMQLEGDFDAYFTVYVPEGYQRDALYFLTPELMAILIDQGKDYSFELVDNNLFIYGKTIDFSKEALQATMENSLAIAQIFKEEFKDNTQRYADDRVQINNQPSTVGLEGRRLKKRVRWTSVLSMMFVALVIILLWAA